MHKVRVRLTTGLANTVAVLTLFLDPARDEAWHKQYFPKPISFLPSLSVAANVTQFRGINQQTIMFSHSRVETVHLFPGKIHCIIT